jgi:hypothetical protein
VWAYATSPHGLNLSPERFWRLSWADYLALREVREDSVIAEMKRWAVARTDYRNVHFRGEAHKQAWTVEEILGLRTEAGTVDQERQRLEALALSMKKRTPASLPAWARMTPEEAAQRERRNATKRT